MLLQIYKYLVNPIPEDFFQRIYQGSFSCNKTEWQPLKYGPMEELNDLL